MNKQHNIRKYNDKSKHKVETPAQQIKKRKAIKDTQTTGLFSHFNKLR